MFEELAQARSKTNRAEIVDCYEPEWDVGKSGGFPMMVKNGEDESEGFALYVSKDFA